MNHSLVQQQIQSVFTEIQYLIRLLYVTQDVNMKNLTLNQLWNKIEQLQFLFQIECMKPQQQIPSQQLPPQQPSPQLPPQQPQAPQQPMSEIQSHTPQITPSPSTSTMPDQQNQLSITREQLAQFDGKNGNPAYVAVNGIVYDVTDNAAWSAATHFGLTAGQDLTQEFASCHAAEQWILSTLKPVGRLID